MEALKNKITNAFATHFSGTPLAAFAPGRINIIGEHTDYNNGYVFPAAIDKGIIAAAQKSNHTFTKIIALDVTDELKLDLNCLEAIPNGGWKNYVIGVIAEIKKLRSELGNFNLVFGGNIPIGGGISSSAALENSIGFVINELFQLGLSKTELIKISQRADHNYVGVRSGIMDHYASMFGEKNTALLLDCSTLDSKKYQIKLDTYRFLLINTNVSHTLASSAYNERRASCERVAQALHKTSLRDVSQNDLDALKQNVPFNDFIKASFVLEENKRVHLAAEAIQNNNLELLGQLLYQSHEGLRKDYEVSCEELDYLVELTKSNDAILGSRMMGGGFGGCTINLIRADAIAHFKATTKDLYEKKFNRKCSFYEVNIGDGTRLV